MNTSICKLLSLVLTLLIAAAAHAQSMEIKNKDGSRWRGAVGDTVEIVYDSNRVPVTIQGTIIKHHDLYIVVQTIVAGMQADKTILKADLISVNSSDATMPDAVAPVAAPDGRTTRPGKSKPGEPQPLGVFYLPLEGMVGLEFRHNEIEAVGREADKYGPGQIIVLHINSGGGLMIEMEQIALALTELKKRHRVVAWIKEAISAAAATASHCHEIYFMSTGALGAMTGFAGGVSLQDEPLRKWMTAAGRWMEGGGRSKYIAWAMIEDEAELSYDKDPQTGRVTWYNDLSGEFILSRKKENLTFTKTTAMHSGFAQGVADTEEELAKLLDLPQWHEINDSGRKIAASWKRLAETAQDQIPKIFARFNYQKSGQGDRRIFLSNQMNLLKQLVDWWNRAPNVCFMTGVPPKENLERMIAEYRKELADMDRRR